MQSAMQKNAVDVQQTAEELQLGVAVGGTAESRQKAEGSPCPATCILSAFTYAVNIYLSAARL
jgi:hypothetical protein